ncbi:hypothetical protein [Achromobacter aegrifaciens]
MTDEIDLEDEAAWAQRDPAIAFQTIDREAVDWAHVGVLMERWARAWVKANPEKEDDRS